MPEIQRLRPDHAAALLAFEQENRDYFARWVSDRGDGYFARFADRHDALLAEQAAGMHHFHLLIDDGRVLGRINLVDVADGGAELGYRVAERATGRGLATTGVTEVIGLAARQYGLTHLRAVAMCDNIGSRTVLARTGFAPVGDVVVGGRPGLRYHRGLPAPGTR